MNIIRSLTNQIKNTTRKNFKSSLSIKYSDLLIIPNNRNINILKGIFPSLEINKRPLLIKYNTKNKNLDIITNPYSGKCLCVDYNDDALIKDIINNFFPQ